MRSSHRSDSRLAAGATSTSARTRSGRVAASHAATAPPKLCPTTTARSAPTASSASSAARALPSRSDGGPFPSHPGRSIASVGAREPIAARTRAQSRPVPGWPWSSRTGSGLGIAVAARGLPVAPQELRRDEHEQRREPDPQLALREHVGERDAAHNADCGQRA